MNSQKFGLGEPKGPVGDSTPGWHPDPFQRHESRWWDGQTWSRRVRDGQRGGIDPPSVDPKPEAPVAPLAADPIDEFLGPLSRTNWGTIIGLMLGLLLIAGLLLLAVLSL